MMIIDPVWVMVISSLIAISGIPITYHCIYKEQREYAGIGILMILVGLFAFVIAGMEVSEKNIDLNQIITDANCDELLQIKNKHNDELNESNYRTITDKILECMMGDNDK